MKRDHVQGARRERRGKLKKKNKGEFGNGAEERKGEDHFHGKKERERTVEQVEAHTRRHM